MLLSVIIPLLPIIFFALLILLLIIWIIVSIPVYISAKIFTGGRATILQSMLATLVGSILYVLVTVIISFFINSTIISSLISFLFYLWVFKSIFNVGWIQAAGIAILAIVFTIIIQIILAGVLAIPFLPYPKLTF